MSDALHPQNHRIGTAGISLSGLDQPRFPPVYVTKGGQEKHETPLCPEVQGEVHYAICREDALYGYGENWCDTCRMYRLTIDGSGWTDPRFRNDGDNS